MRCANESENSAEDDFETSIHTTNTEKSAVRLIPFCHHLNQPPKNLSIKSFAELQLIFLTNWAVFLKRTDSVNKLPEANTIK